MCLKMQQRNNSSIKSFSQKCALKWFDISGKNFLLNLGVFNANTITYQLLWQSYLRAETCQG